MDANLNFSSETILNDTSHYYSSYQNLEVHKTMLNDKVRNETYKNAIYTNKHMFKDKTILDVGAGTGILSIFCAQVGARKVYAVEVSNVAKIAKEIVKENKLDDVIEVIENRIEDVSLPCKVDVIVSEWMGFYLLHEGMLDSVLFARDNFLQSEGKLFPEECILYTAACQLEDFFPKWNDVCGVQMKSFGLKLRESYQGKPEITYINEEDLMCVEQEIIRFNLNKINVTDLDHITEKFIIPASKDGNYQGICIWFDVLFPHSDDVSPVVLSTSPWSPETHWKHTVIVLPIELEVEADEPLAWELELKRNNTFSRRYDLKLTMLDPEKEKHPSPCGCYYTKCMVIKTFLEDKVSKNCGENSENLMV
uniref:type I protein arginine methyltransferase n=1 Tax=Clastoptera arizonana TaxID=38151 RepID=A0A1B6DBT6_9HEMI